MKASRLESVMGVVFIGLSLGWTFMGIHQHNASYADVKAALGAAGGASVGAALVVLRDRYWR